MSLISIFITVSATAQKLEVSAAAYSGFASFSNATADKAIINRYAYHNDTWWVAYPFGKTPAFSIGAEGSVSFFIKPKIFASFSAGYEELAVSTKVNYIGTLYILSQYSQVSTFTEATGKVAYHTNFLTLLPMAGYRTAIGPISADISAGLIIAPVLSSKLKGSAIGKDSVGADFTVYTNLPASNPKTDIRKALQIKLEYKKLGLIAGYQWGSKNYIPKEDPGLFETNYSNAVFKIGHFISYQIILNSNCNDFSNILVSLETCNMRKSILLAMIACCGPSLLVAQKLELYGTVYSGVAGFKGEAAAEQTEMVRLTPSQDYFANPYGKKTRFSTGADIQFLIRTKSGIIFNFAAGFQSLATVIAVNAILPSPLSSLYSLEQAVGKINYRADFITLFPSVGYRIKAGKVKIDLNAGVVFAPCVKAKGEGSGTSSSRTVIYSETDAQKPDVRPSLQATVHYKKFGFTGGYQWGTRNYCDFIKLNGQPLEAMMRFSKLGVSYRIK